MIDERDREIANLAYQVAELRSKIELVDENVRMLVIDKHKDLLQEFLWTRDSVRHKLVWIGAFFGALFAGIVLHYLLRHLP